MLGFSIGWLSERGWFKRLSTALVACVIGMSVMYVLGLAQLAAFLSLFGEKSLMDVVMLGFVPFVPGSVLKIYLALAILRGTGAQPVLRREPTTPVE